MSYIHTTKEVGGAETTEWPEAKPGWHSFTVATAYDQNKDGSELETRNGTKFIRCRCQITDGDCEGARVSYDLFLTAKSAWKIDQFLVSCGNQFSPGQEITITPEMFEGYDFRGLVKDKVGNDGVTRQEIEKVAPMPATPEPPSVEEVVKDDLEEEMDEEPRAESDDDPF